MNDIWQNDKKGADFFKSIEVRPIVPEEKTAWNELMDSYHYLGCKGLIGETLRYIASYNGQWLALIGWGSASLCNAPRDSWIGWTTQLKYQRLYLIANNVRFLILPQARIKNLASKVLSLNLQRLSDDWQHYHGHPLLMVETFVDPRRFLGTCYQASNWCVLGKTKGFRKSAKKYIRHDQPKVTWCKPLCKQALELLTQAYLPLKWRYVMTKIPFSSKQYEELRHCLRRLPEYRQLRGMKYSMGSIIAIAICAILCGARSYAAIYDWGQNCSQSTLRKLKAYYDRKDKKFVAPSERTIRRVLQACDAAAIDEALSRWVQLVTMVDQKKGRGNKVKEPVAIDGKVARGAKDASGKQVHLLSAFLHDQGVVVSHREIASKTNEIPEIKPLINALIATEDRIFTADALHTQRETARFIVEDKKADYVFTVKDNQPTLNADIKALNLERFPPDAKTVDHGHGRIETRKIWTSTKLNDYLDFPHVGQVFIITREVTNCRTNETKTETVSGITSLSPEKANAEQLLKYNRNHWSIENRLHYVRDFTYDEDRSQIRVKNGPRMMACLRNFVISLLRLLEWANIAKAIRTLAGKPHLVPKLIGL